jgi:RNA polymerase-binding transcription factor DksA
VTDQFDRAQALELAEYERNQQKAIMPKAARPSAGERIPDARRKAIPGVERCIGCQDLNEKNKGRYANSN